MEAELYLPVYRRSFRGDNSIFSPWCLSCFVTKLFISFYLNQVVLALASIVGRVGQELAATGSQEVCSWSHFRSSLAQEMPHDSLPELVRGGQATRR